LDRIKEAITDLRFAVQQAPDNPDIRMSLGTLYLANKQPRQAIKEFDDLLALDVKHWSIFRRRADALLSIGKQAEAIADYEAALKLDPKNSGVLNNLAWVLATSPDDKLRDGTRAVELAKRAAEETEYKESYILSTLAAAHAEAGDYANAVKWSEKAVELGEGEIKEQLAKELASFREGKPWRELQATEESEDGDAQPDGEPKTAEKERTPRG
jgi:Tfp pilus assembly protein PilF